MDDIPLSYLFGILAGLIVVSAFFSSSETALMALNRYRVRHLANNGHRGAQRAQRLLQQPDRLLGLILLGNNLVNIFAASLATVIAIRLYGESAVFVAGLILTAVILIFAEVAPKTIAALKPQVVAFPASFVLRGLLWALSPLVWLINQASNGILRLFQMQHSADHDHLTSDELRTLVHESGSRIPVRHQRMLLNLLDLKEAMVDDIMIPRSDVAGIDLNQDWPDIIKAISDSSYTRLVIYRESIDNVIGLLHIRSIIAQLSAGKLAPEGLHKALRKPYFIPEGTSLTQQLLEFQRRERRIGLVVDEYGDIQGLVTLDDILEEIVGEYTTEPATLDRPRTLSKLEDGSLLVRGDANLRSLNRRLDWGLPTDGPRTLNGLVLEQLETIPDAGATVEISGLEMTIVEISDNRIESVRIVPTLLSTTSQKEQE